MGYYLKINGVLNFISLIVRAAGTTSVLANFKSFVM